MDSTYLQVCWRVSVSYCLQGLVTGLQPCILNKPFAFICYCASAGDYLLCIKILHFVTVGLQYLCNGYIIFEEHFFVIYYKIFAKLLLISFKFAKQVDVIISLSLVLTAIKHWL